MQLLQAQLQHIVYWCIMRQLYLKPDCRLVTSVSILLNSFQQNTELLCSETSSLLVASTCGPLAAVICVCRDTAVQCSVVGSFLWPARRPETRYQTIFVIRRVLLTVFIVT